MEYAYRVWGGWTHTALKTQRAGIRTPAWGVTLHHLTDKRNTRFTPYHLFPAGTVVFLGQTLIVPATRSKDKLKTQGAGIRTFSTCPLNINKNIQLYWTEWCQSFIRSLPLTSCLLPLKSRRNVASLAIFYRCFHANCSSEHANCMPLSSHGLAVHVFLHKLTPILSKPHMQEWTSTFSLSSLSLVSSGTAFLPL